MWYVVVWYVGDEKGGWDTADTREELREVIAKAYRESGRIDDIFVYETDNSWSPEDILEFLNTNNEEE